MRKRGLEALEEEGENGYEPPSKKMKLNDNGENNQKIKPIKKNHAWKKSEIFKWNDNPEDKQQYDEIYEAIDESEFICNNNISQVLVQQISDYALGELVPCCNKDCPDEMVCFLQYESNSVDRYVNCPKCGKKLYWHYCMGCDGVCSSFFECGTYCGQCTQPMCKPHLKECVTCEKYLCDNCSKGNKCDECVAAALKLFEDCMFDD